MAYKENLFQSFGASVTDNYQDVVIPQHKASFPDANKPQSLDKRAGTSDLSFNYAPAELSAPPGVDFLGDTNYTVPDTTEPDDVRYKYYFDDSAGAGQYIYVLDAAIATFHDVSARFLQSPCAVVLLRLLQMPFSLIDDDIHFAYI